MGCPTGGTSIPSALTTLWKLWNTFWLHLLSSCVVMHCQSISGETEPPPTHRQTRKSLLINVLWWGRWDEAGGGWNRSGRWQRWQWGQIIPRIGVGSTEVVSAESNPPFWAQSPFLASCELEPLILLVQIWVAQLDLRSLSLGRGRNVPLAREDLCDSPSHQWMQFKPFWHHYIDGGRKG